ncbi:MAG: GTPase HflX [Deltaproteobacteria bacterium]|jgi:GTPase|nr:GTPase HflX [Deltaproteobacteria bacterium]
MSQNTEGTRAILLGYCALDGDTAAKDASMEELERLAQTADIITLGTYVQRREKIHPRTFIGEGFIETSLEKAGEDADLLIFDHDLTGSQARNLEKRFSLPAIDRTEVILRIFHAHARTREARLQVRLAELKYELPRVKSMWGHLDRERSGSRTGGGAAFRGMGEKQSEMDRQKFQREIYEIEKTLKKLVRQIDTQKKLRKKRCRNVGLVGYTNAGKSTLFNRLTNARVLVEDKLFATLDSTSRSLQLGNGKEAVISDTVGFISNLPHHLVASFRATLKEAEEADFLLHVTDISDENHQKHMADVETVLKTIGADRIPQILVFNKIDRVSEAEKGNIQRSYPDAQFISAATGRNVDLFLQNLRECLHPTATVTLLMPLMEQKRIHDIHNMGKVLETAYEDDGVRMTVEMAREDMRPLEKYLVQSSHPNPLNPGGSHGNQRSDA